MIVLHQICMIESFVTIGLTTFKHLKPWFVYKLKEQNTYCCKYHIKMEELRKGFNNMWTKEKGVRISYVCNCEICGVGAECSFAHIFWYHNFVGIYYLS
jgi:hypothetical protein